MQDAGDRPSWDVLHEDADHVLAERRPQEAHDVAVSDGLQELHLALQATVLPVRHLAVPRVQAHLLHSYQLTLAGQTTVHLEGGWKWPLFSHYN